MATPSIKTPKYRSGLERLVATLLTQKSLTHSHESTTLRYVKPVSRHRYIPDFDVSGLTPSVLYLETKGRLTTSDRKKMLLVVAQHPEKLFVMLFSKPNNVINKSSKTRYCDWADANGIRWCSLDDFEKDPKKCLLSTIRKKVGKLKTQRPKS